MRSNLLPVASGVVLILTILSFVFSLLTATSPRWTVQDYYLGLGDATTFETVLCSASRSPFYRCGIPRVDDNGTCIVPDCQWYPAKGTNLTSCRLASEVGTVFAQFGQAQGTLGGYQECQQVHMAGGLQIASSIFSGLGLLFSLSLFAITITVFRQHHYRAPHDRTEGHESVHQRPKEHHEILYSSGRRGKSTPFMAVFVVFFLGISAALQLLAQFFGILGLSVAATPTATQIVQESTAGFGNFGAGDWILDIALTRYASVAWAAALLDVCLVLLVFRVNL